MIALAMFTAVGAGAQTIYDATNIAQKELNGTARFVGMGGAMGALGGDISTIGTNPAGIGIYRSNDAMLTFGYSMTGTESNYVGNKFETNKNRWSFDNAGFVIASKIGNHTPLRYVNFGFNYHKSKSFYKNMTMQGLMGSIDNQYVSQVRSMAQQATDAAYAFYHRPQYDYPDQGAYLDYGRKDIYQHNYAGWLGTMGYQGALVLEDIESEDYNTYLPYIPSEADAYFLSRERGGIDQYDFNISFNINDRFYFGVTLGAYDVDYNKYSLYDEMYAYKWEGDGQIYEEGYSLESFNRIHGSGFDFKFGAIFRPIEDSPLRIGLAVHTPTYYKLTYTTGALLTSDLFLPNEAGDETLTRTTVDTYSALGGRDMDRDFKLQTPWVFNASLGYTVGNNLALGAEYEYEDYSSMKFKYPEGDEMAWETGEADLCMKGVSTLRLGAEYKPIPAFSLRAGYNYSTAVYKKDAIKALPSNSINTDTDFANSKSMNTFTLGIGYRFSSFYADLAYKFDTYKSDFYPFYNDINGDLDLVMRNPYIVTKEDIEDTFQIICKYSVHSFMDDIKKGFITLRGGHRIGIVGKVIIENGQVKNIKHISSLNIRVSREIKGCSKKVLPHIIKNKNQINNTIIISPPQCGKTTILRDIVRNISNGNREYGFSGVKVALIDERNEIAGSCMGVAQLDVGMRTDVMETCPKDLGIMMVLRSMSPNVIVTDEIGNEKEIKALYTALNGGVSLITTVHGDSIEDILHRTELKRLLDGDLFRKVIILSSRNGPGTIEKIYDLQEKRWYFGN